MAVLGFSNTILFLILETVVIVAGIFVQRILNRVREVNPLLLNTYSAFPKEEALLTNKLTEREKALVG
jgi:hypothetical protein